MGDFTGLDSEICNGGLHLNTYFNTITGMDALRPEAKLLFSLGLKGPLSVKEAMFVSGLSYRGFYGTLGRLIDSGMIEIQKDRRDGRVRRVSLTRMMDSVDRPEKHYG